MVITSIYNFCCCSSTSDVCAKTTFVTPSTWFDTILFIWGTICSVIAFEIYWLTFRTMLLVKLISRCDLRFVILFWKSSLMSASILLLISYERVLKPFCISILICCDISSIKSSRSCRFLFYFS